MLHKRAMISLLWRRLRLQVEDALNVERDEGKKQVLGEDEFEVLLDMRLAVMQRIHAALEAERRLESEHAASEAIQAVTTSTLPLFAQIGFRAFLSFFLSLMTSVRYEWLSCVVAVGGLYGQSVGRES